MNYTYYSVIQLHLIVTILKLSMFLCVILFVISHESEEKLVFLILIICYFFIWTGSWDVNSDLFKAHIRCYCVVNTSIWVILSFIVYLVVLNVAFYIRNKEEINQTLRETMFFIFLPFTFYSGYLASILPFYLLTVVTYNGRVDYPIMLEYLFNVYLKESAQGIAVLPEIWLYHYMFIIVTLLFFFFSICASGVTLFYLKNRVNQRKKR